MTEYSYPDVCYSTEYINLTLQLHHGHGKLGWWQLWDKRKPRLYEPECEENKKTLNDTLQLLLFNDRAPFGYILSFITGFGWVLLFPHLSCMTLLCSHNVLWLGEDLSIVFPHLPIFLLPFARWFPSSGHLVRLSIVSPVLL